MELYKFWKLTTTNITRAVDDSKNIVINIQDVFTRTLYLILFLKKEPATARLIGKKKYVDKKNNFKLSNKSRKMSFQKFISLV